MTKSPPVANCCASILETLAKPAATTPAAAIKLKGGGADFNATLKAAHASIVACTCDILLAASAPPFTCPANWDSPPDNLDIDFNFSAVVAFVTSLSFFAISINTNFLFASSIRNCIASALAVLSLTVVRVDSSVETLKSSKFSVPSTMLCAKLAYSWSEISKVEFKFSTASRLKSIDSA